MSSGAFSIVKQPINSEDQVGKFNDSVQWVSFKELFNAIIETQNINPVQKLVQLMQALEGEAKDAVMKFEITSGNYPIVWETLEKQFGQSKYIEKAYHRAILDAPVSDDLTPVAVVKKRFMEFEGMLEGLEQIGGDINHEIFATILESKLPSWLLREVLKEEMRPGWTMAKSRELIFQLILIEEEVLKKAKINGSADRKAGHRRHRYHNPK
ncbi:hypothetical protein FO519_006674 [Halicephalobus sp. NKZ332]|nr:hypothetical protein FO519_006674 [Halicephalobus sp. NKZ332]